MTAVLAPSRRILPARRLGTPPPNARVVARTDLSPTMARFAVELDDGPVSFTAGQYVALGLEIDGRLVQRPYSLASVPVAPTLDFAVRLVAGGALTTALWRLHAGDRLHVGPPRGLFGLADGASLHLMLATGTGIAPIAAMARALGSRMTPARVLIVHGAARIDELAYADELGALAAAREAWSYVPAISRPTDPANVGWRGRVGRLDAILPALLGELDLGGIEATAYLCGNPRMVAEVSLILPGLGLPPHRIRSEAF